MRGLAGHLHAADLEAEGGLRRGRILGLAALDVGFLGSGVPRLVAHLDVDDGGPVVLLRHILQLQQVPPSQIYRPICGAASELETQAPPFRVNCPCTEPPSEVYHPICMAASEFEAQEP